MENKLSAKKVLTLIFILYTFIRNTSGVGAFSNLTVSFSPSTINTSGSMIVSALLGSNLALSSSSYIDVIFDTLAWTQQLNSSNVIPIQVTMSCTALQIVLNPLTCIGLNVSSSSKSVRLLNSLPTSLSSGALISFTINGLKSPPTTQQSDRIIVRIVDYSTGISVIESGVYISGLLPKSLNISISSSSPFLTMSSIPLTFAFYLTETLTNLHTFKIVFPIGTKISFVSISSNLQLGPVTYDNYTSSFLISLHSAMIAKQAGERVSLIISQYICPNYYGSIDPIFLRVLYSSGIVMEGSAKLMISPKVYNATVNTENTTVNAITAYSLNFMLDEISSTGYLIVKISSQLADAGSLNVLITSSLMSMSPLFTFVNNTLTIRQLNLTTANVPTQNMTIRINGLRQPSTVKNISYFEVQIFYSNFNTYATKAVSTNTVRTTAGSIFNASVVASSYKTLAQNVVYSFAFRISNQLSSGFKIKIITPLFFSVPSSGIVTLQGQSTGYEFNSNVLTINVPNTINAGTQVFLSIASILRNPASTQTKIFFIETLNQVLEIIDQLSTSNLNITMAQLSLEPAQFSNLGNDTVFRLAFIGFFEHSSLMISFELPGQLIGANPYCSCFQQNIEHSCYLGIYGFILILQFQPSNLNSFISMQFYFHNMQSQVSCKPLQVYFAVRVQTSNSLYQYSNRTINATIKNIQPKSFSMLSIAYQQKKLYNLTNVTIHGRLYTNSTGYMLIKLPSIHSYSSLNTFYCLGSLAVSACEVDVNDPKMIRVGLGYLSLNMQFDIVLKNLLNPDYNSYANSNLHYAQNPVYGINVTTYTEDNYAIEQGFLYFKTDCNPQCRTCQSNNPGYCLTCNYPLVYQNSYLCISSCYFTFYNNNGICVPCEFPCYACSNRNECSVCLSPFSLQNNKCVQFCENGKYSENYVCVNCRLGCSTCISYDNCSQCLPSFILYQNKCYNNSYILPVPFTLIGFTLCLICLICWWKKKQMNLINMLIVVLGLLQTAALVYLIVEYQSLNQIKSYYNQLKFSLMTISVSSVCIINLFCNVFLCIQSYKAQQLTTAKFLEHKYNSMIYFISILLSVVNFKARLLYSSNFLELQCFKMNIKQRSFISIMFICLLSILFSQLINLYLCFSTIWIFNNKLRTFSSFVDLSIITIANIVLCIIFLIKNKDSFNSFNFDVTDELKTSHRFELSQANNLNRQNIPNFQASLSSIKSKQ